MNFHNRMTRLAIAVVVPNGACVIRVVVILPWPLSMQLVFVCFNVALVCTPQLALISLAEERLRPARQFHLFRQELDRLENVRLDRARLSVQLSSLDAISPSELDEDMLLQLILTHPQVVMRDRKVGLSECRVFLADQDFKPAWGSTELWAQGRDEQRRL